MTEQPEDRIRELRVEREILLDRAEGLRLQIFTEIRRALPQGNEPPRGLFTRVVEATGWTRAYVADIRDGKKVA
jgi:hypothetical protein